LDLPPNTSFEVASKIQKSCILLVILQILCINSYSLINIDTQI
jgi:hypothetical protein